MQHAFCNCLQKKYQRDKEQNSVEKTSLKEQNHNGCITSTGFRRSTVKCSALIIIKRINL